MVTVLEVLSATSALIAIGRLMYEVYIKKGL
jgi:hypothetical protein